MTQNIEKIMRNVQKKTFMGWRRALIIEEQRRASDGLRG
jgi:hypothetical protein